MMVEGTKLVDCRIDIEIDWLDFALKHFTLSEAEREVFRGEVDVAR